MDSFEKFEPSPAEMREFEFLLRRKLPDYPQAQCDVLLRHIMTEASSWMRLICQPEEVECYPLHIHIEETLSWASEDLRRYAEEVQQQIVCRGGETEYLAAVERCDPSLGGALTLKERLQDFLQYWSRIFLRKKINRAA